MGEMRNVYKILVRKPEGKRVLRRSRYRLEYNIRMNLREMWWEGVKWMCLAQNRDLWHALVNTIITFGFHKRWGIP
jgi:hypothetical protein